VVGVQAKEGRSGSCQAAEVLYRKAMDMEPQSVDSMVNLAVLLNEEKRNVTEAETLFVRALRIR
jgi:hypothetical protein